MSQTAKKGAFHISPAEREAAYGVLDQIDCTHMTADMVYEELISLGVRSILAQELCTDVAGLSDEPEVSFYSQRYGDW